MKIPNSILMFQALKPTSSRTEERVNEVIRNKKATKRIVTTRLSKRIRKTDQAIDIAIEDFNN